MRVRFLEIPPLPGVLDALLEALVCVNTAVLWAAPERLPHIYDASTRVYWVREPLGVEDWYVYTEILLRAQQGLGSDCEDLAGAVAAHYRVYEGVPARAIAYEVKKHHYHAVVELPDGTIEDPSRIVGRRKR